LSALPKGLADSVRISQTADGCVEFEVAESLTDLLGWLASLPLGELRIEPVGLATIYDHYHRESGGNGSALPKQPDASSLQPA
jgi:ABC-2 type transport system ATP-binding protein